MLEFAIGLLCGAVIGLAGMAWMCAASKADEYADYLDAQRRIAALEERYGPYDYERHGDL